MADFHIHVGKPIANILSSDKIDFVWVPEPLEEVQERTFRRSVIRAVKEKLPKLVQKKIVELQPNLHKEKEAEYQRGLKDGLEKGQLQEQEKLKELKEKFAHIVQELVDYRKKLLKEAETTIVTIAFGFARNIVGEAIQAKQDVVQNQVKKVLEYVVGESKMVFYVHPDDVSQFDDKEGFIPQEYLSKIEIVPDEKITRGGCILETNAGTIDATIEAQIAELASSIKNSLEHELEPDIGENS